MACPTDILSTETQAERNKPQELSGEACSQLPQLGGQARGRVSGHLGQRPKPETLGLGHVARSEVSVRPGGCKPPPSAS